MSSFLQSITIFVETKGTNLVVSAAAVVFGVIIINNLMKMIKMALVNSKLEKSMIKLVLTIVQFGLYFLLLMYVLKKLRIGITGVVAAFSAFSLAIGLAIQDVIGGFATGLVLVTTRPFKVGDFVSIGDVSGTVRETNLLHTVLDTPDQTHIYLPNKTVYNSEIKNFSTNPVRRLDYETGVDFDADNDTVKALFLKTMLDNPLVLKDPAPVVMVNEVGASEVVYKLRCWVQNKDYWTLNFQLKEQVLQNCRKHNIGLAFPQVTISQREPIVIRQEESK